MNVLFWPDAISTADPFIGYFEFQCRHVECEMEQYGGYGERGHRGKSHVIFTRLYQSKQIRQDAHNSQRFVKVHRIFFRDQLFFPFRKTGHAFPFTRVRVRRRLCRSRSACTHDECLSEKRTSPEPNQ